MFSWCFWPSNQKADAKNRFSASEPTQLRGFKWLFTLAYLTYVSVWERKSNDRKDRFILKS